MKQILYFTSKWCSPCRTLSPLMNELAQTYSMILGQTFPIQKIDIDENEEYKQKFNINSVPTIIVLENGFEKKRLIGLRSKKEYIQAFEN